MYTTNMFGFLFIGNTLKDLQNSYRYRMQHDYMVNYMGASDLRRNDGNIRKDGKLTNVYISYNGRLWDRKEMKKGNHVEVFA